MKKFISILVLGITVATRLAAAVLVDNGAPNPDAGAVASNFAGGDPEYAFQSADDFQLAAASTITHLTWWGLYQGSNVPLEPDVFTVRIFSDNAGSPAIVPLAEWRLPHVRRAATGLLSGGYDVYEYNAVLTPHVALPAGTYWLSIVNDVDTEEVGTDWLWMLSDNSNGNFVARFSDDTTWQSLHPFALAFQIHGVPQSR
jgi:hypothetical protein